MRYIWDTGMWFGVLVSLIYDDSILAMLFIGTWIGCIVLWDSGKPKL